MRESVTAGETERKREAERERQTEREEALMVQKSLYLFNILLTLAFLQTPNGPFFLSIVTRAATVRTVRLFPLIKQH